MKAYYAHCMAIYHTPQEDRDIELLKKLGFEVVNPSSHEVESEVRSIISAEQRMNYFERFADECDILVFRGLPDGTIPSGVAKEIGWFQFRYKPILELPSALTRRTLTFEMTREFLREIGQR